MYYNGFKASVLKAWRWHQLYHKGTDKCIRPISSWLAKIFSFQYSCSKKLLEHWKSPLGHFLHFSLPTNQKNKKVNNPKHTLKLANQCQCLDESKAYQFRNSVTKQESPAGHTSFDSKLLLLQVKSWFTGSPLQVKGQKTLGLSSSHLSCQRVTNFPEENI